MSSLADSLMIPKGVTAVIGSGGKTTLIRKLAEELSPTAHVIITTTTKIYPPDHCLVTDRVSAESFTDGNVICVGTPITVRGEQKLTAPQQTPDELRSFADYILVEADGSRHFPLKIHAPYEPVIPENTDRVIRVVGISGIGKPVRESVHRWETDASLDGDAIVTPELAARLLRREPLADTLYIAQITTDEDRNNARLLQSFLTPFPFQTVILS